MDKHNTSIDKYHNDDDDDDSSDQYDNDSVDSCDDSGTLTFGELLIYSIDSGPAELKQHIQIYIDKLSTHESMLKPIYDSTDLDKSFEELKTILLYTLSSFTYIKFIMIQADIYDHIFKTFNTLT